MTFPDKQKEAEFKAFQAYYAEVAKRPYTATMRSLMNNLRSIAVGQYGNGAWQQLVRDNRATPQPESREVKLGKQDGGGSLRRNQSPGQPKQPKPGSPRDLRLKERAEREGRSAAPAVVAGGETAESLVKPAEKVDKRRNIIKAGEPADMKTTINVEDGVVKAVEIFERVAESESEFVRSGISSLASDLSAKELVEKYGREILYVECLALGETADNLDQKTDRQLANILKKKVSEA